MAVYCAKCGAEVPAGAQFCAVCGTAVGAAAAPASQGYTPVNVPSQPTGGAPTGAGSPPLSGYTPVSGVPPAGYAPAGGYVQPAVAPVKSGGSALKIILIIVVVLVGLGILGVGAVGFTVWRVAHAFHVNSRNGQVTLNTPSGSVTASNASNFTSEELGTDIYPGAQPTTGGMRMNLPTGSVVSGVFLTSDSKEQVVAFYKNKLGSEASVFDAGHSAMISVRRPSHDNIMISVSSRESENDGKTKISIVHTKTGGTS